ncbi:3-oxoacyl-[acyl-carrier-protein] reductase [Candidatus Sumerlaeota bacterium]|nr:3-oxoacyl-[acyl-carrier-protein] reductase [Candidatus Sumerlaeota bacterium]
MLDGKVAVVTGSGQGIGKAVALKLAQNGADVVISDINEETMQSAVEEVKTLGRRAIAVACNVTSLESCENLMQQAVEQLGSLDILVNNAGVTRDQLMMRMKEEDFDFVINVNLKGVFNCCKAGIPRMPKRGPGSVINMASVVGIMGNPGQVNYSASKAGVIGMTRTLAKEYAKRGIRVNAIAPGFIQSAMTDAMTGKAREAIIQFIPLQTLGAPEDVANIALFLASGMSSYVTGQVIQVDGGMIMA